MSGNLVCLSKYFLYEVIPGRGVFLLADGINRAACRLTQYMYIRSPFVDKLSRMSSNFRLGFR